MIKIPLHSLVVVPEMPATCGHTRSLCLTSRANVDFWDIRKQISGRADNRLYDSVVWQEAYRRTNLLLEHGNQVVFTGACLHPDDVDNFLQIADRWGISLFWVLDHNMPASVGKHYHMYNQVVKKIKIAKTGSIVQPDVQFADPVCTLNPTKILAVGDVHGNVSAMQQVVRFAEQHDLFIVWLGDVVDYGSHNLKCMKMAYQTVISNQAHMIWGNHERKISKWIHSNWGQYFRGRLSDANLATIGEIQALPDTSKAKFLSAWRCLENHSTQHLVVNNWLFTHGSATPEMWSMTQHRLPGVHGERAYFGEVLDDSAKTPQGYPVRTWHWVHSVPHNHNVVVGHDWLDHDNCCVTVKQGAQGGNVICVDTGSGKGGRLSAVVIDLKTQKWEERYFDT